MCQTWTNGSDLVKRVTLKNNGSQSKKWSQLEIWVTVGIMDHTWPNNSHFEKNGSQLEMWVTIGKMGHIWQNKLVRL